MGILNVTPDSFSDGGLWLERGAALAQAERLVAEGADILDIGGESTRPGAAEVSVAEEIDRVVPLIEVLARGVVPVSVDTSKPEVMRAALAAGAAIVNDVRALRVPGAIEVVARAECGIVLMHMRGTPRTMQAEPSYEDVVAHVLAFLAERRAAALAGGIAAECIAFDPGFGFGKTTAHNFRLLASLRQLALAGQPLLVGLSRKSMLGKVAGRDVGERLVASVAAAVLAVERGARIVRAHDVAATRDAIAVWQAMKEQL
jgi:dihydropteroate synthase